MKKTHSATGTGGAAVASSTLTPQSGEYSLYFHVPFCTKKCDYCHFYVIPDQQRYKELYMRALKQEWELRLSLLPRAAPLSIYFGGGTPALLGPAAIEEILSWVSPTSRCEITLEANPENITYDLMHAYHNCGINRVSIGVQSLNDSLLTTLSRTHSAKRSLEAVIETRDAGISNISIDLMYDLPGQTLDSWQKTLELAALLPITHLSLYNLTIEPHTVFYKKRNTLKLPDSETSLEMLSVAIKTLENHGLKRYEISAFAKNNQISNHNIGYWKGRSFLGFGPSAFSYWNGCRFRNVASLNRYSKALKQLEDPVDFKETLPEKEKLKESLAIALRLLDGVALTNWPHAIENGLTDLEFDGFLKKERNTLKLTEKGLLFHDTVAERIMAL